METSQQDEKADADRTATADTSQPAEPDLGFIPRPDASLPVATEETKDRKPAPRADEKKSRPSSSANAYKSMFVKGASEFLQKGKEEEEKRSNGVEKEEELPEGKGGCYCWVFVGILYTFIVPMEIVPWGNSGTTTTSTTAPKGRPGHF